MARNHSYSQTLLSWLICLNLSLSLSAASHGHISKGKRGSLVKGMFVFGSSVVDNGNNNYRIVRLGRANYLPYGIDFPFGPTGRFSNGKNVADVIGGLLGLPLLPAFADPRTRGRKIIHGVNFGSGGSGILDDTGSIAGGAPISMNQQIKNFEYATLPELKALLGQPKPTQVLDGYLFLTAIVNNDFGLNYFLQQSSSRPSLPVFVANLTSTYAAQLQKLYDAGARKFVLLAGYPLGCSPMTKQISNSVQCVQAANAAVQLFNDQSITMVDGLKQKLPGSEFIVVNTYKIIMDIIEDPISKGFTNATDACCELREIMRVGVSCKKGGEVCAERNKYVYFDGQHLTEAANDVIASKAFFSNSSTEVYPFNLQRLALL
uniref:Triacylglycerol lipase n=1 Tax=Opuntia streptacantha TaxID=393608 RepID=A0A7C9A9U0_OPUST